MSRLLQRIDSVFLVVKEFEKAITWYSETLGLEIRFRNNAIAAFNVGSSDNTALTLVNADVLAEGEVHPQFNFFTEDIEAAHAYFTERKVDVGPIRDYGDMRTFDFKDLDGHTLNVVTF
ncbi:VOC family protein [Brevibacillus fulvus]|uniref:Catechol 2,3-dioxygenase-like lactoylglutathione lyase family enzyme n=1 Tax=Brevibacillus fulvus TaxID=1125967 RepID=A0A939BUK5_9BACL|nr:VOC family protein [Brevibacillus fulvus]MBM7589666.1 catechol 2,3-dioxygenase-like lactoylglutathione lyase family enzyme [Brevibacillus fulvus]